MQGNQKISFTAEAAALIRAEEKVDNYSKNFVTPRARRYASFFRTIMPGTVDRIFKKRAALSKSILSALKSQKLEQIVELGAGYSATGIQLTSEDPNLIYIETDFSDVEKNKERIVKTINASSGKLFFIPVDILQDDLYGRIKYRLKKKGKTAIFSEGVSSYLNEGQFDVMIEKVHKALEKIGDAVYISHERVSSMTPGILGRSMRSFISLITKSKSHQHFKSPDEARHYYKEKGFSHFRVLEQTPDYFIYETS